jgi:hypothetical protein
LELAGAVVAEDERVVLGVLVVLEDMAAGGARQ